MRRFLHIIVLLVVIVVSPAVARQNISGTLLAVSVNNQTLEVDTGDKQIDLKITSDTRMFRGQVGFNQRPASIKDFAPGDRIVANADEKGNAVSVKGFFGIIKGTLKSVKPGLLLLSDGRNVAMSTSIQIIKADGGLGTRSDLASNQSLVLRVNPLNGTAWTALIVSNPTTAEQPQAQKRIKLPSPEKPKLDMSFIGYQAPSPAKSGDRMTVTIKGTPGAKAGFAVTDFIPYTILKEQTPGVYTGEVAIPTVAKNSAFSVIGSIILGDQKVGPIQAAALLRVDDGTPVPNAVQAPSVVPTADIVSNGNKPQSAAKVEVTPVVEKNDPPVVTPQKSLSRAPISLLFPSDGARLKKSITVKGNAEPDSTVRVEITYSNGKVGLLKLAGDVMSQSASVGKNGLFSVGPIALEGPLATDGLVFRIKAYYTNGEEKSTVIVKAYGARD